MAKVDLKVIEPWIEALWNAKGSDLLLSAGSAPRIRVSGSLRIIEGEPKLSGSQMHDIVHALLSKEQAQVLEVQQDVDFAFSWLDRARLRASAFTQRGELSLALRMIPNKIPTTDELGLPVSAQALATRPRGLILVTGPTGSGKSTTLASLIDSINETRPVHILTIEDPIEYVHENKLAAVSQREIGLDSPSFDRALRSALREDPDVLLLGEMRDIESIQFALTIAETGHLVFATLHTNDAPQAVDRIIDVFPDWRQDQVRVQLANALVAIVAQRLVPKIDGGMVAAYEILLASNSVRNLIREGKSNQLMNVMTMQQQDGMRTMETSLSELVVKEIISHEEALNISSHPKELNREIEQAQQRKATR